MRTYLLFLGLLGSCSSWAQSFTLQKVDPAAYPEVSLTLKNSDSGPLDSSRVRVRENNQPVAFFLKQDRGIPQQPISICFLIEVGGFTTERQVAAAKGAIRQLLTTVDKHALVSVAYFARPSSTGAIKTISSEFTQDFVSMSQDLSQRVHRGGEDTPRSELFKAVYECLEYFQSKGGELPHKQIILISTGNHTGSSPIALAHCVEKAKGDQVVINAIGLRSSNVNAVDNLRLLAQQTGGRYQSAASQTDISNALVRYTGPVASAAADPTVTVLTYHSPTSSADSNRVEVLVGEEAQAAAYANPQSKGGSAASASRGLWLALGCGVVLFGLIVFLASTRKRKNKLRAPAAAEQEPRPVETASLPVRDTVVSDPVFAEGQPDAALQKTMVLGVAQPTLRVGVNGSYLDYPLTHMVTSIGRNANNHIVINNTTVSSFHAEVIAEGGRWFIQDKGSTNGVVVDGATVRKSEIKNGSLVQLGEVKLQFTV